MRARTWRLGATALGVVLALTAAGVATAPAASAAPTVTIDLRLPVFSPEGDGQDDTSTLRVVVSEPVSATAVVRDGAGATVRTVAVDRSLPQGPSWLIDWDGSTDAGSPAPDGTYTVRVVVTAADGFSSSASTPVTIDRVPPARIASPAAGAHVAGRATFAITPGPRATVHDVTYALRGLGCTWQTSTPGPSGTFPAPGDLTHCDAGDQTLTAVVGWTDVAGVLRSTTISAPVVVDDVSAPVLTVDELHPHPVVARENASLWAVTDVTIGCVDASAVTWRWELRNGAGGVVRAWEPGDPAVRADGSECRGGRPGLTLDGTTRTGAMLPGGEYTLVASATDRGGRTGTLALPVTLDERNPATMTWPAARSHVSGSFPFAARAVSGVTLVGASVTVPGCATVCESWASPVDGVLARDIDLSRAAPGFTVIQVRVLWADAWGGAHSYLTTTGVFHDDVAAPTVTLSGSGRSTVDLSAPGVRRSASVAVSCVDGSAVAWDWTLRSADGTVVRRSPTGNAAATGLDPLACRRSFAGTITLDGTDGSGRALPDGPYTLTVTATDDGGLVGSDDLTVWVDTRIPATIAAPTAGARLEASVDLAIRPGPGTTVQSVGYHVGTCDWWVTAPGSDGRFAAHGDLGTCRAAATEAIADVTWVDVAGLQHTFRTSTPVTLTDLAPPTVHVVQSSVVLARTGPGSRLEKTIELTCDDASPVAWSWTLARPDGAVVRSGTAPAQACGPQVWLGIDAGGPEGVVADGAYVLTVTGTDSGGLAADVTLPAMVLAADPGRLIAPVMGEVLGSTARFLYVPGSDQRLRTSAVTVAVGSVRSTIYGASPDGIWRTSVAAAAMPIGQTALSWSVTWLDPFGGQHVYSSELAVTVDRSASASPAVAPATVYRFWSPRFNNAHFFTMDAAEAQRLRASDRNWTFEGDAYQGYPLAAGACGPQTTAVYRFWSPRFQSHFFTASAAEKASVSANDPSWTYEGVAFCAATSQVPGSVPLYRFWSPRFGKHFFTADPAEAHRLDVDDPSWDAEGIAFFVQPAG